MSSSITVLAGKKALGYLRDGALTPDMVRVIPGAAGGPKWLVLNQLDRALFSGWFKDRKAPLYLLGASIGAWRFSAAAQQDPLAAVDRFEEAYTYQFYRPKPTPEEISLEAERIIRILLGQTGVSEILSHPYIRLNVLAVRSRGLTAAANKYVQGLGFIAAYGLNSLNRKLLGLTFDRALFYDPRNVPPFFGLSDFPIIRTPLNEQNLIPALRASAAIPMVMAGINDVPGASSGVYRDAGVIDYHMDIPFLGDEGVVLYPHFSSRVVPGWLDKRKTGRKPSPRNMENVVLIAPADDFVSRLPYGKIPDRNDFYKFAGHDLDRLKYWIKTVHEGKRMADDFMEATHSGKIREMVRPFAMDG